MNILRTIGIFGAAFAAAIAALLLVFPLGLLVYEAVIFPLALGVAALLAALAGGWAGNWHLPDQSRTRLLAVVGITEASAAALVLLFLTMPGLHARMLGPLFGVAVIWAVVVALSATAATMACRTPLPDTGHDRKVTFTLLGVAVVAVPGVVVVASLLGLAGA